MVILNADPTVLITGLLAATKRMKEWAKASANRQTHNVRSLAKDLLTKQVKRTRGF